MSDREGWEKCRNLNDPPRGQGKNFNELQLRHPDRTNIWRAWAEENRVFVQWGELCGKIQQKTKIFKQRGKPRQKNYVSADQAARDYIGRLVGEMHKSGYKMKNEIRATIDFVEEVDRRLLWSRPMEEPLQDETMERLSQELDPICSKPLLLWVLRVRGLEHTISKDLSGRVWIQNEDMEIVNDLYPHLEEEFDALLPEQSIYLATFFIGPVEYADLDKMVEIASAKPKKAIRLQKRNGLAKAYVHRMPFWKGADIERCGRIDIWHEGLEAHIDGYDDSSRPGGMQLGFADTDFILGPMVLGSDYEEVVEEVDSEGLSGCVVWRGDKALGELSYSTDGIENRPPVSWVVWDG